MENTSHQTALIVSSWPTDREFIAWLLSQRRFICREVGSLKTAVLALSRGQFDLIVVDYHLVKIKEEFSQIREAAPTTQVVLVSESTTMADILDDQTVFLQRGQLTYHLLEKIPGYHLEDRVLHVIEERLLRWARPVLFKVDPTVNDLEELSEIVSSWLRRRRTLRTLRDELSAKIKPMAIIAVITTITYLLQQWANVLNWRVILAGIGLDVGS